MFDNLTPAGCANKARFIGLLKSTGRPGMDDLLAWLETTDFYTAPASSNNHGAVEGGLLEHSLAVYKNLDRIIKSCIFDMNGVIKNESAIIVTLLHDFCKTNFYTVEMRNKKDHTTADGVFHPGWNSFPFYAIDDQFPIGHGEKSVIILQQYIRLTAEEMMAIRWHMGSWDTVEYGQRKALAAAMDKYPLVLALQMADQAAVYFDKK